MSWRRAVLLVAAWSLLVPVLMVLPAAPADAAELPAGDLPTVLSTVGGPGHADLYPSGMEVAPDGTIVVANTGDNAVQKYAADGTLLWRIGDQGSGQGEFDNPRDIGILDDGTIFVADTANLRVVRLAADGTWLGSFTGLGANRMRSPIGLTVSDGEVLVADGGARRVRVYATDGTPVASFGESGACSFSAIRDVDRDRDGNFYIANYTGKNVLKLSPTGTCLRSWGELGDGDGQFRNPYGVAVAFDPVLDQELVYVNDSNNGRNQVFTTDGTFVGKMGQLGDPLTPGQYAHTRRVAVATDGSGDVWIADLWGWKVERWARTSTGWEYAQTIQGNVPEIDAEPFNEPRGIAVRADGRFWVADTVHHRVMLADVTGEISKACGSRGWQPGKYNWPRGVAVDHQTGNVWVTDTKQSRLQVIQDDCTPVSRLGERGDGDGEFNWPMSIAIRQDDRIAFVTDTNNARVTAWDVASQAPLGTFDTGLLSPQGIAVDPATRHVFVADTGNDRVVELASVDGSTLTQVAEYAMDFEAPEAVAVDADGRIWVADTGNDRVTILADDGTHVGTMTTDGAGTDLVAPSGLATDLDNRVVISDTGNDRLLVASYDDVGLPADPYAIPTGVGEFAGEAVAEITSVDVAASDTHYYAFDVARYRLVRINRATGAIDATLGGTYDPEPGGFAAARSIARSSSTGDIYVADTVQNRIVRTTGALDYIEQFGTRGNGQGQFQQVYGVATGLGRGAGGSLQEILYTMDGGGQAGDGRIQRFSLDGTWLGEFAPGAHFNQPRMIEVHPTTNDLWVVNARDRQVIVFDVDGNERFRFGSGGSGDGQFSGDPRGLTISADGTRAFVADEGNRRIQVFDATDGSYLAQIGEGGGQVGQFTDPRGIQATQDGILLVSDQWAHNLQEFDIADGTVQRRLFGADAPVGGTNSPRGLAYNGVTDRVYNSDWWNQRVARWDADGSNATAWGYRGIRSEIGSVNFAWDVAVQDGTGFVFLANRESHEIEVFDHQGDYVTRFGNRGTGPGNFEFPQGVAFDPTDGTLLVADSQNHRIQRFSIDSGGNGTFVASYGTYGGFASAAGTFNRVTGLAVAPDGTIWAADTGNNRIQRRDPDGTWTSFRRPNDTSAADNFASPWGVSVAPDGAIWVADSGNDRIVKMDAEGDLYFTATGQQMGIGALDAPFDVEFLPGDRVLIADTWNNRIMEVTAPVGEVVTVGGDVDVPATVMDTEEPDAVIDTPTEDQVLRSVPVAISGTATDDVSVDTVDWAVRDTATNLWWQADGTWGPFAWLPATLANRGSTSTGWSASFDPGADGKYVVTARATDDVEKVDPDKPFTTFEVVLGTPDTEAPAVVVDTPSAGSEVVAGSSLDFTGSATDDTGVDAVYVAVRDRDSGKWLHPDGTWGDYENLATDLTDPDATSTDWSITWPGVPAGRYGFSTKVFDVAGKSTTASWRTFDAVVGDEAAPTIVVDAPPPGAEVTGGSDLDFTGSAGDDVGVEQVVVAVRDLDAGTWLQPDGTWGSYTALPAALADAGATSTTWSWTWSSVPQGRYGFAAKAFDGAGKVTTAGWQTFDVTSSDDVAPSIVVDQPANRAVIASGEDLVVAGMASDEVGVDHVAIAIRDRSTNLWLQPDGTWGAFTAIDATMDDAGATTSAWTSTWATPPTGSYGVSSKAFDAAGNEVSIWRVFTVA